MHLAKTDRGQGDHRHIAGAEGLPPLQAHIAEGAGRNFSWSAQFSVPVAGRGKGPEFLPSGGAPQSAAKQAE